MSIARKGVLLIALPMLTQIILGGALILIGRAAVEAHRWELHSQEVLGHAHAIRSSLLAAQSNLRAFVLTQEPQFRAACDAAAVASAAELRALSRSVEDNRGQIERVQAMSQTAKPFIDFQMMNMALVDRGRAPEAAANIGRRTGDVLMSAFLKPMDEFLDTEASLAAVRHGRAYEASRIANAVVIAGIALNVLIAAFLAAMFSSSINRRLQVLTENAQRLGADQPLLAPLSAGDEIAQVDRCFHEMAASLAQATEELQQSNREMEAFSYSVSHDLRAPLRAIDGFSRILEEDHAAQLDDEAKRLLGVVRRNTVTMAELIDDLLTFSRLSRQPITNAEVDMQRLAERTFADVASHAPADRTIEFVTRDLPPAQGDGPMLRQAFENLISNAVKFTATRDVTHIEVGGDRSNGETVYYVRDNGVGFDMRFSDKLFGVFQRLHDANEFEGTGVGLAIVQRVIQRHGGRVWATSTIGEGSTFFFALPQKGDDHNARP